MVKQFTLGSLINIKPLPSSLIALLLSATTVPYSSAWMSASAQSWSRPSTHSRTYGDNAYSDKDYWNTFSNRSYRRRPYYGESYRRPVYDRSYQTAQASLNRGTQIPIRFDEANRILVSKDETLPINLTVARNVSDNDGRLIIPEGSLIKGQIEPAGRGSRFVAREVVFDNGDRRLLQASSRIVTRTETIQEGASTDEILGGTLAGAGAATLIAGLTGDRKIGALEVLAGAAVGALAGWALPTGGVLGGAEKEVISIDPDRDLTLRVTSDAFFE